MHFSIPHGLTGPNFTDFVSGLELKDYAVAAPGWKVCSGSLMQTLLLVPSSVHDRMRCNCVCHMHSSYGGKRMDLGGPGSGSCSCYCAQQHKLKVLLDSSTQVACQLWHSRMFEYCISWFSLQIPALLQWFTSPSHCPFGLYHRKPSASRTGSSGRGLVWASSTLRYRTGSTSRHKAVQGDVQPWKGLTAVLSLWVVLSAVAYTGSNDAHLFNCSYKHHGMCST